MKRLKRFVLPIVLSLLLTFAVGKIISRATPRATPQTVNSGQHFLPPYTDVRDRFGFDSGSLSGYDVSLLNAGWYSDWGASPNPAHPGQLAYVQLVHLYAGSDPHDPSQVRFSPSKAAIAKIAAAHPGSLWFLGNEPDSIYLQEPVFPDVYAIVYHDLYEYIKGLDPSALIANGGIVQPTPCRLMYLDIVWDTYLETYGEPMPVDVWNTHAFVLREVYNSWGASTPPGVDRSCAMDYTVEEADDLDIFWDNIKALRTWMKDKEYQDKPLIISEYGILWPQWWAPQFTQSRVSHFMTQTFELFLYDTDPDLGYPADDHRLIQAWAWYSLSDETMYNGYLFYSDSKDISLIGSNYAAYTAALSETLRADLSAHIVAALPSFTPTFTESLPLVVTLTGNIGNLGKLPATDVLARFETVLDQGGTVILGHDAFYTVPARFDGAVTLPPLTTTLIAPGRHELRFSLDPEDQIEELREWNNVATVTLDWRPDLTPISLTHQIINSDPQSKTLVLTATVGNQGTWASPAVSMAVHVEATAGSTLSVSRTLLVPPLAVDEQVSLETSFPFTIGLYTLQLAVDPDHRIAESNEENNVLTTTLDAWPDLLPLALDYRLSPLQPGTGGTTARLALTNTVRNQGLWHSPAASATIYLETIPWETVVMSQSLPLPAIAPETQISLTTDLTWLLLDRDLYRVRVVLDEEGQVPEQNHANNQQTWAFPITVRASLAPTLTTVLTNGRGDANFVFPAGTVTTPTEIIFTPFWPLGQVPASIQSSPLAFSLTTAPDDLLTLTQPVSVTWRYGDDGTVGLDAGRLQLFVQRVDDDWQDAACQPYQRDPAQKQITVFICQTGQFVFGTRHDAYLPLIMNGPSSQAVHSEMLLPAETGLPPLPPRLSPR